MTSDPAVPPIVEFASDRQWAAWLAKNGATSNGVWIRFYKKGSGAKSITYPQAVEQALRYGWIDGQGKGHDDASWLQKFTPRRPRSVWSKLNTERAEVLIKAGKMTLAGLAQVEAAKRDGRWQRAYAPASTIEVPADFLKALRKDKKATAFYETLNKRNTYAIAYRLQSAKKPETRQRRMQTLLEMLSRGEKLYP